jgi:hypothetical protein
MQAVEASPRPAKLRSAALVALSLAAFGSTSSLLMRLKPWPDEYGLRAKYEYLADHGGEFDTLFVGSSVTLYGVVPPLFDSVMAEHGHPTHSFNLGVGGMTSLEGDYLLQHVLARHPGHLKYVFVEASNWDAHIYSRANAYASRMANWHSLEQTLVALECNERAPTPPDRTGDAWWRWDDGWLHLQLAASHYLSVGQGPRIALALLGLDGDRVEPTREDLDRLRGYVELDHIEGDLWKEAHSKFLAQQEKFLKDISQVDASNAAAISVGEHFNIEGVRAQVAAIRACGAEPIYYVGPRTFGTPLEYRMAEAGFYPVLLGFNQPSKYPELYLPERHFDMTHFNRQGADEFTRRFAEAFAEHLDAPREQ